MSNFLYFPAEVTEPYNDFSSVSPKDKLLTHFVIHIRHSRPRQDVSSTLVVLLAKANENTIIIDSLPCRSKLYEFLSSVENKIKYFVELH